MSTGEALFQSPTGPIRVRAPGAVLDATKVQAPAWPRLGESEVTGLDCAPLVEGRPNDDGTIRFRSSAYAMPAFDFAPGLFAANGLIGGLIGSFVTRDAAWLSLHGAAVAQAGGLTVLVGDNMAGKSTLAVALMLEGCRLWSDDRLPVRHRLSGDTGLSLALRPKLRLPLPAEAPSAFSRFVAEHGGPAEGGMVYLVPPDGFAAGYGEAMVLRRILLLQRTAGWVAALSPLSAGQAVKALLTATFAPHLQPIERIERLRALSAAVEVRRFAYADSFAAARALVAAFGTGR